MVAQQAEPQRTPSTHVSNVLISCVEKSEGLPKLILSYKAPRVAGSPPKQNGDGSHRGKGSK